MRWFAFIDTAYYPYVVQEPIEADTAEEALQIVVASECLGLGDDVYVTPMDAVTSGRMQGPRPEPQGLLKLMEDHNRLRDLRRDVHGGYYAVVVEPGSVKP